VDGRLLVEDQRLVRLDEEQAFREAQKAAEDVWNAAKNLFE
jgi:hypothetical protein